VVGAFSLESGLCVGGQVGHVWQFVVGEVAYAVRSSSVRREERDVDPEGEPADSSEEALSG
jgi:hypothetical protein